jgi:hydrogenase nickel incorporation protein HypA/HybF
MSLVCALVEQVRAFVPAGATLLSVRIEVGALEHLDDEVLLSLFGLLTEGTPLAGAGLAVTRVPLRVRCAACGTEHAPPDPAALFCPACGVARPEVLAGSGVTLSSIEVDVPEGGE